MGRELRGGAEHPHLGERELGLHLTQYGQDRGLPACQGFILIHPTVWPQYTNVTDRTDRQDRQDRQRSDGIGRTVLQTAAQKCVTIFVTPVSILAPQWYPRIKVHKILELSVN